jgi:hypothetical protein
VVPARPRSEPDTAFVWKLPQDATPEDVLEAFPDAIDVKIVRKPNPDTPSYALVKFADREGLRRVTSARRANVGGSEAAVYRAKYGFADPRRRGRGRGRGRGRPAPEREREREEGELPWRPAETVARAPAFW